MKPRFPAPRGRWLVALGAAALGRLCYDAVVTLGRPERAIDLLTLRQWCQEWLQGHDIYTQSGWNVDYPPWALPMLSPLAWTPERWLVPLWVTVELTLALLLPYLAVRALVPRASRAAALTPLLMCLLWDGGWTTLQLTRLTMVLGFLAMLDADRRAGRAGLWLGLALAKPQVAAPFLLWALLTRQWRVVATAMAVVATAFAVYCAALRTYPTMVLASYVDQIRALYFGPDAVAGLTSLRGFLPPWLALHTINTIMGAVALATTAFVVACGFAERTTLRRVSYSAPALACLVPLLVLFNFTNNLVVLILPAVVALLYANDPDTAGIRAAGLIGLQVLLVVQPTLHAHRVLGPGAVLTAIEQTDRVIVLALFVSTATLLVRRLRSADAT